MCPCSRNKDVISRQAMNHTKWINLVCFFSFSRSDPHSRPSQTSCYRTATHYHKGGYEILEYLHKIALSICPALPSGVWQIVPAPSRFSVDLGCRPSASGLILEQKRLVACRDTPLGRCGATDIGGKPVNKIGSSSIPPPLGLAVS